MPMNKANWSRPRAANRPSKRKTRAYDQQNDTAAAVTLASPEQHTRFQIDWAQRYTACRSRSREEVDR